MDEEGSRSKLTIVSSEKDLGMWITSKPDFSLQCDKASAKAMQSLGLIKRTFNHLTSESFLLLYKTYIRPHLEYCESIWSLYLTRDIDKLEKIQQRATKLGPEIAHSSYLTSCDYTILTYIHCIVVDREVH